MTTHDLVPTTRKLPKYAQDANRPYEGDPWTKQPGESPRAFECFCIFRDLENRTQKEAERIYRERYGLSEKSTFANKWATKHRWIERVEAYDAFMDAKRITAMRRQKVRSAEKHAQQAAEIADTLMMPMNKLRARIKASGDDFDFIDAMDDESLMKLARSFALDVPQIHRAEREALGSVTENPVVNTKIIAERGALLKRVLADPNLIGVMERLTIETTAEPDENEATG
jgi:hypothetical protein